MPQESGSNTTVASRDWSLVHVWDAMGWLGGMGVVGVTTCGGRGCLGTPGGVGGRVGMVARGRLVHPWLYRGDCLRELVNNVPEGLDGFNLCSCWGSWCVADGGMYGVESME